MNIREKRPLVAGNSSSVSGLLKMKFSLSLVTIVTNRHQGFYYLQRLQGLHATKHVVGQTFQSIVT